MSERESGERERGRKEKGRREKMKVTGDLLLFLNK